MPKHATRLLEKSYIAENTLEVVLEKPQEMTFLAGQNINIKLPHLSFEDKKGARRTFTISSAPQHEHLTLTMRMTGSGFKKTMEQLPIGTELEFMGPNGRFYLYEHIKDAVIIAAGIGITPFKSMLQDAIATSRSLHVDLLYSNKTLAGSTFHNMFVEMTENSDVALNYVPTITGNEKSWQGDTGRVNMQLLQQKVPDYREKDFLFCGPPRMVDDTNTMLLADGISEEKIHSEVFWGY
jgi:ferredoxin-NADP reductase